MHGGCKMVAEVKEKVNNDARYTTRQIAGIGGISLGAAYSFHKSDLKIRKRWAEKALVYNCC
jgi:hypothetical protein